MESNIPHPDTRCCYNCHFLMAYQHRADGDHAIFEISLDKRTKLLDATEKQHIHNIIGPANFLGCKKWIWKHNRRTKSPIPLASDLTRDHGDSCFFHRYTEGMSFGATEVLEARAADRREAERDRDLTRHALNLSRRAFWISFAALIVSIAATIGTLLWNIWAHFNPVPPSP